MPKQHPEDLKKQIVLSYRNGTSISAICKKYHISQSTLYRWLKEYKTDSQGYTSVDHNTLLRQHNPIRTYPANYLLIRNYRRNSAPETIRNPCKNA